MRTKKSVINMIVALSVQIELICIGFISRRIFIRYLSVEYLGCNSVFSNVIEIISMVGCGASAVSYLAIKAVATDDESQINKIFKIIHYYQWITCGLFMLIGSVMSFFLSSFLVNATQFNWSFLQVVYFLYLLDLCISMWSGINGSSGYYDCVIKASQNQSVCSFIEFIVKNLCIFLQMGSLIVTQSYYLYLILGIVTKLIYIFLSRRYCYHKFPFLKEKCTITRIDIKETKLIKEIRNNFAITIAIAVFNGTDNLVLTGTLGIAVTGLYSNYELFYNQLRNLINKFVNGMGASIGNFLYNSDESKKIKLFDNVQTICAIVACICSNLYFSLAQSFITIFFGEGLLLDTAVVFSVSILCFISFFGNSCSMFRHPVGQYWIDRNYQIASAAINLLLSIILARKIGVIGIMVGTAIGIMVSNAGYLKTIKLLSIKEFSKIRWYFSFVSWLLVDVLSLLTTYRIVGGLAYTWENIFLRIVVSLAISLAYITVLILCTSKERKSIMDMIIRIKSYIAKLVIMNKEKR